MAPKPFTPNVYALDGAFGVANPESQPTAQLFQLQSVFALDRSAAQARGLQRRRVKSTPWNQGRIDQQNNAAKWAGFQHQAGNSNNHSRFFGTQQSEHNTRLDSAPAPMEVLALELCGKTRLKMFSNLVGHISVIDKDQNVWLRCQVKRF